VSKGKPRSDPVTLPDLPPDWTASLLLNRVLPEGAGALTIDIAPRRTQDNGYVVAVRLDNGPPVLMYADTFAEAVKAADLGYLTDKLDSWAVDQAKAQDKRQSAVSRIFRGDEWKRM
jgi:hypothetical protein